MNKTALITGASRGIGREIAHEFAGQGYDLFLTCITNIDTLKELAEELTQTHAISCHVFQADMGNFTDIEAVFKQIATWAQLL